MARITLSLDRPTGNFWMDTGLVVLLEQFGEGEHESEEVLRKLVDRLVQKTGKSGVYFDQTTGQFREYEKVNWVYPTNLFIKVSGVAPKIEMQINGKTEKFFTQPPVFDLSLKLSKNENPCDICGDVAPLTDAKMWMYPFVVEPGKFGTFYPGTKRGLKLCARCALAGLAGDLGWLWKAQGKNALHFFIFHADLREMKRLHEEVLRPLQQEGSGGTAPVAFFGPYLHETTLGLLLALFAHVPGSDRLSETARRLLATLLGARAEVPSTAVTLYAVTGKPGQAFNMQALREFSRLQPLYRLYEQWLQRLQHIAADPHQQLVRVLAQFQQRRDRDTETLWRDRIARAILEFDDPLPFVEQFLFEARAREEQPRPLVSGTLDVLNHYIQEVLGMEEQFRRTLAGFGHTLGAAAHEHNEMGLLYSLRNARNPEDFYRVLNDAQFRLEITVPEALLQLERGERIAGVPWGRVKTLLAIYAMNAYLRKSAPQTATSQPTEQEE